MPLLEIFHFQYCTTMAINFKSLETVEFLSWPYFFAHDSPFFLKKKGCEMPSFYFAFKSSSSSSHEWRPSSQSGPSKPSSHLPQIVSGPSQSQVSFIGVKYLNSKFQICRRDVYAGNLLRISINTIKYCNFFLPQTDFGDFFTDPTCSGLSGERKKSDSFLFCCCCCCCCCSVSSVDRRLAEGRNCCEQN